MVVVRGDSLGEWLCVSSNIQSPHKKYFQSKQRLRLGTLGTVPVEGQIVQYWIRKHISVSLIAPLASEAEIPCQYPDYGPCYRFLLRLIMSI